MTMPGSVITKEACSTGWIDDLAALDGVAVAAVLAGSPPPAPAPRRLARPPSAAAPRAIDCLRVIRIVPSLCFGC